MAAPACLSKQHCQRNQRPVTKLTYKIREENSSSSWKELAQTAHKPETVDKVLPGARWQGWWPWGMFPFCARDERPLWTSHGPRRAPWWWRQIGNGPLTLLCAKGSPEVKCCCEEQGSKSADIKGGSILISGHCLCSESNSSHCIKKHRPRAKLSQNSLLQQIITSECVVEFWCSCLLDLFHF